MSTKVKATKMRMTQLFKGGKAFGVTPLAVSTPVDFSGLEAGVLVRVSGITKGHGFAGVVKRHDFRGGPKTHGQKDKHRSPGSIGSTAPQRVLPGRRMAGHMGMVRITTKNIPLVEVDAESRILMLHGAVPGVAGREVEVELPVELQMVEEKVNDPKEEEIASPREDEARNDESKEIASSAEGELAMTEGEKGETEKTEGESNEKKEE